MYFGTARFEELKDLELRQISKKGALVEIQIRKGKWNQTRKLQRCIIHHNLLDSAGKICPVKLIDCYLSLFHKLGHNSDKDYLFPNVKANFKKSLNTHYIVIPVPIESMTYNNYRDGIKKHLDDDIMCVQKFFKLCPNVGKKVVIVWIMTQLMAKRQIAVN